jgi:hypothetical protein
LVSIAIGATFVTITCRVRFAGDRSVNVVNASLVIEALWGRLRRAGGFSSDAGAARAMIRSRLIDGRVDGERAGAGRRASRRI